MSSSGIALSAVIMAVASAMPRLNRYLSRLRFSQAFKHLYALSQYRQRVTG